MWDAAVRRARAYRGHPARVFACCCGRRVDLQLTLALPEETPDIWTQILLQRHPEELGDDFQMSFRALLVAVSLLMRILVKVHPSRSCGSLLLK